MEANGIPTARYKSFTNKDEALAYCDELGAPLVVKADGLAAGKGVIVAETLDAARAGVEACFSGEFGSAGNTVVVEEMLTGPECSLLAFVTNGKAFCMAPAQDHKRAYDGDLGPNTGGMGVYSPVPIVSDEEMAEMVRIMEVAAAATAKEPFEHDYRGVLYGGFMLTPEGPKVLEFNARFGDPETQVVLPRLKTDFVDIVMAVVEERLAELPIEWSDEACACVVMASGGYPGHYEKGIPIEGLDENGQVDGAVVYHAGTALRDGKFVTNGGRVLGVTATGETLPEALKKAYEAVGRIHWEGVHFRHDIGVIK